MLARIRAMDQVMLAGDAFILVGIVLNVPIILVAGVVLVVVGFARSWHRRSRRR